MRPLPSDCVILTTGRGGLLVSRSNATFCGLDEEAPAPQKIWSHATRAENRAAVAAPSRLARVFDRAAALEGFLHAAREGIADDEDAPCVAFHVARRCCGLQEKLDGFG